jgi:1,4-dihydroxy-2-naphthoate octaprenyltransferase
LSGLRIWLMAARPRTLPAAVAPVLVGTAAAVYTTGGDRFRIAGFVAALLGSVFIQIGTNLANDYSDARRGADAVDRLGPVRVTSSGLVAPRRVLIATWVAFGVAIACGIYLTVLAGPLILLIGALSILAGVLYTGGPRPYGYEGLGELFVFLFFGLVAVNGSYFVQVERLEGLAIGLSVAIGLLTTAILVVNNIRDIEPDRRVGKRTLAVRLGRPRTRALYTALLVGGGVALPLTLLVCRGPAAALLGLLVAPIGLRLNRTVHTRTDGPSLNSALAGTGMLVGGFSVMVSAGLLLAA